MEELLNKYGFKYSHDCGMCQGKKKVYLNPQHYHHEIKIAGASYTIYYQRKPVNYGNVAILEKELQLIDALTPEYQS